MVETWRTKAFSILFFDSVHTTYLETIYVLLDAAKISVVGRTEQRVTQFLMTACELQQLSGSGRRLYLARLSPDLG